MGEQRETLLLPCLQQPGAEAEEDSPGGQGSSSRLPTSGEAWLRLQEASPGGLGRGEKEGLCHKHQEPRKLFCKEDLSLLCLVCEKARQHRAHLVLPLEEAAQDYKEEIEIKLQKLKTERSAVQELKMARAKEMGEYLNLKETFTRCEKATLPLPMERPYNLEKNLSAISQKSVSLMENLKKFKETLKAELKRERRSCTNSLSEDQRNLLQVLLSRTREDAQQKASIEENVVLDPRTANPKLLISLDQKRVRHWGYPQALPDNLERFDLELFVLACEGFCSGKHSWKVAIEQGQSWAVGIARESVKRKGPLSLSPEQGIWAVEQCWGHFRALTSQWTSLPLAKIPRTIQVCLDYERGRVAFFDADLDAPIFKFPLISFKQERIYPWFWVGPGGQLSLCL